MTDDADGDPEDPPQVIDISLLDQIRKERIVAVVFILLLAGMAYLIYLNLH